MHSGMAIKHYICEGMHGSDSNRHVDVDLSEKIILNQFVHLRSEFFPRRNQKLKKKDGNVGGTFI